MPTEISIPDKPDFDQIKRWITYIQDMSFDHDVWKKRAELLEITIKIQRELERISIRYDSQLMLHQATKN